MIYNSYFSGLYRCRTEELLWYTDSEVRDTQEAYKSRETAVCEERHSDILLIWR
jgi:hypothetical protein